MSQPRRVASVAAGILSSRVLGLLRMKVLAHFLGVSAIGDVWVAAIKGPNVIQNLLGEQALSAAFIPIYVRKLADDEEQASKFASAIFSLLLLVVSIVSAAGVLFAAPIVTVLNPGLLGDAAAVRDGSLEVDRFELAVTAVRVFFPMAGILVLSAWCIAILNSHRRFFLSYFAPIFWNLAIIAAVLWVGLEVGSGRSPEEGERILLAACGGALVGALFQFMVQFPTTIRLAGRLRPVVSLRIDGVRESMRLFGPALLGRSAAQLSGYLDLLIGGFLAVGSLAALGWAQALYLLPIALFSLSFAAVELPELSRQSADGERNEVAERLRTALGSMSFLTVPTVVGYLVFGFLLVGVLYRGGHFGVADNWLVYLVLAAYSLGLLATTISRLLQTAFFAHSDTRTPTRIAFLRLSVAAAGGVALSWWLDRFLVRDVVSIDASTSMLSLGAVGLALASAVSAWLELALLQRHLRRRIPGFALAWSQPAAALGRSVLALVPALPLWWLLRTQHPVVAAPLVLGVYVGAYLLAGYKSGLPDLSGGHG